MTSAHRTRSSKTPSGSTNAQRASAARIAELLTSIPGSSALLENWVNRFVFSLVPGDHDAHAKNIALIHNEKGTELAPAYDTVPNLYDRGTIDDGFRLALAVNGSFDHRMVTVESIKAPSPSAPPQPLLACRTASLKNSTGPPTCSRQDAQLARPPIILSVLLARIVRVVAVGVMLLATSGCTGEPASFDPCPTPAPTASPWPEYVVDLQIPNGVLIDVGVFGDGRETVGQWSIASVDLGSTADVLRQSLVTQGFTLEG